ncbi:MAG: DUF445 family protein [Oscillospiraceae bacterium]|nr:DUF445 family protein [Oscillospiraceae bacterium]
MPAILFKFLLAILLGAIIGYITNDVAIWMLFHPHEKKWILHGVIPKNQSRLAQAIGDMVAQNLLDTETLKASLLTDETFGKIRLGLAEALHRVRQEERTLRQILEEQAGAETVTVYSNQLAAQAASFITSKITEEKVGKLLLQYGSRAISAKQKTSFFDTLWSFKMSDAKMTEIGNEIDLLIAEKAPELLESRISGIEEEMLSFRVCDLYQRYEDKEEALLDKAVEVIRTLLEDNMERLMREINLRQIVVDKINDLNPAELEQLLKEVIAKELSFIVWAGAALGALMGIVQGIINLF